MKKESDYTQRLNPKTHLTQKYIRKRARKITSIQNNLKPENKCKYMGSETKYLRLQIQRSMTIKKKKKKIQINYQRIECQQILKTLGPQPMTLHNEKKLQFFCSVEWFNLF